VDGHSVGDILDAITESGKSSGPGVVVCNTVKGKGVKFAESDPVWHYRTLNEDLLHEALEELR
jgi:transketolase